MYRLNVKLRKGLSQHEKLPNDPIKGVDLNSPLGVLLSCLQGDFIQLLEIHKKPPFFFPHLPVFDSTYRKTMDAKDLRDDFFSEDFSTSDGFIEIGSEESLSEEEFQILCDVLKKSQHLKNLHLYAEKLLTEKEEQQFVAAIKENIFIEQVVLFFTATTELVDAIKAIKVIEGRQSLEFIHAITVDRREYDLMNKVDCSQAGSNIKQQPTINMYLLQGFIAALGVTSVAISLVFLSAASLNPLGLAVATLGAVTFAGGAYSFFKASGLRPIEPQGPIAII